MHCALGLKMWLVMMAAAALLVSVGGGGVGAGEAPALELPAAQATLSYVAPSRYALEGEELALPDALARIRTRFPRKAHNVAVNGFEFDFADRDPAVAELLALIDGLHRDYTHVRFRHNARAYILPWPAASSLGPDDTELTLSGKPLVPGSRALGSLVVPMLCGGVTGFQLREGVTVDSYEQLFAAAKKAFPSMRFCAVVRPTRGARLADVCRFLDAVRASSMAWATFPFDSKPRERTSFAPVKVFGPGWPYAEAGEDPAKPLPWPPVKRIPR